MNLLAKIRRRRSILARWIGSVLVVVSLNAVAQPCLMAMEMAHDCVHCPPAMHESGSHEAPGSHGAPDTHEDCGTQTPGLPKEACAYLSEFDHDRQLASLAKDGDSQKLPLAVAGEFDWAAFPLGESSAVPRTAPSAGPPGPALNLVYCVFLN